MYVVNKKRYRHTVEAELSLEQPVVDRLIVCNNILLVFDNVSSEAIMTIQQILKVSKNKSGMAEH